MKLSLLIAAALSANAAVTALLIKMQNIDIKTQDELDAAVTPEPDCTWSSIRAICQKTMMNHYGPEWCVLDKLPLGVDYATVELGTCNEGTKPSKIWNGLTVTCKRGLETGSVPNFCV